MKTKIAVSYKSAVVLPEISMCATNEQLAATLASEMMTLGFIPTKELMDTMSTLTTLQLTDLYNDLIPVLKSMKGADVTYAPMYPNFPAQVMEASYLELFLNAICHYATYGVWMPKYEKHPVQFAFEHVKFREIGVIGEDEFGEIFNQLVSANESLSDNDKQTIEWFASSNRSVSFEGEVPFKENLCFIAGLLLKQGKDIVPLMKTATDVLRVAVALSDGDISLAANTKFKSLPRKTRRVLVAALENVATEEDFNRHRGMWTKLFHNIHIGELGSDRLVRMATKIRNNIKVVTFNSEVEAAVANKNITSAVKLLSQRPGEYARRIDHLLRIAPLNGQAQIITSFLDVISGVNTRVLLQLFGNLKVRGTAQDKTVVFPKGNVQRAQVVYRDIPVLLSSSITALKRGIHKELIQRFSAKEPLGTVWIDPALKECPLPTQMRSASTSMFQVGRGTCLPLGDKSTLRFFVYWVGQDIDLSASLHDSEFKMIGHISYTKLKSEKYEACHSGDITRAPDGASEFIDITIDSAVDYGARYVVMNLLVYSGPTFAEHKTVYAGWMTRDNPNNNEIYDPKTVEQKLDITAESKVNIPIVFDLVQRKVIWTDLNAQMQSYNGGNNIESNAAGIEQTLSAIIDKDNKVTLFELFSWHAEARGSLVENKENADMIFAIDEGITPYDIATINSIYIK
jgi:hypothetical protein